MGEENRIKISEEDIIKTYSFYVTNKQHRNYIEERVVLAFSRVDVETKKSLLKWFYNRNPFEKNLLKNIYIKGDRSFVELMSIKEVKQKDKVFFSSVVAKHFPHLLKNLRKDLISSRDFRLLHYLYKKFSKELNSYSGSKKFVEEFIKNGVDFYILKKDYKRAYALVREAKSPYLENHFIQRIGSLKGDKKLLEFLKKAKKSSGEISLRIREEYEKRVKGGFLFY